jgi:hypothetical protein
MSMPCWRVVNAELGVGVHWVKIANQVQIKTDLTSLAATVGSCEVSDGTLSGESEPPKSRRVGRARFRTPRLS